MRGKVLQGGLLLLLLQLLLHCQNSGNSGEL